MILRCQDQQLHWRGSIKYVYSTKPVCTGKVFQQAVIKYFEISDAGVETEVYRVTMGRVVITSTDFSHAYVQGSRSPNMLEVIGLRYNSIEWFYIPGVIKYDDAWRREPKEEDKPREYK